MPIPRLTNRFDDNETKNGPRRLHPGDRMHSIDGKAADKFRFHPVLHAEDRG